MEFIGIWRRCRLRGEFYQRKKAAAGSDPLQLFLHRQRAEVRQPERVPGIISVRPDTSDTAVMPHSFPELAAS